MTERKPLNDCAGLSVDHSRMLVLNIVNYTHDFTLTVNYIHQLLLGSITTARPGEVTSAASIHLRQASD